MPTCPNGHQSTSEDWCEVCGHRMAGPAPAGPGPLAPPPPQQHSAGGHDGYGYPSPPPPQQAGDGYGYPTSSAHGQPAYGHHPGPGVPSGTAQHGAPPHGGPQHGTAQHSELCPQCRTPRESQAPFCEECRYNFHTQSATAYAPPAPPPGFLQQSAPPVYEASRPSRVNRPAEPIPPQAAHQAPAHQAPARQAPPQGTAELGDWNLAPPGAPPGQRPHPHAPNQGAPGAGQPSGYGYPAPGGAPPVPETGWLVSVGPDRAYFSAMMRRSGPEGASLNLPAYAPEQQVQLTGEQLSIGRRRHSTGEAPDIDLSRPPEDPGVSHQHALLVRQPDGGWAVIDQDSTNGTTLNGAEDPIQPFVPVPLREGDRVHVGAWTTITLHRG
ncbi:FHA domain-containing protein [Streptomyces sp. JJ66]|uniref:FHA domain-containing protein n=1 Tax=Streptomyces sp. JJ66 TaxID=2803843 RepID=UPI001C59C973|nr:FHA domain-containing protein [Streptomyces sp. JJ66]MBW1601144.1 FHA domain-containing protein [Streptomyces sp. JJ66]